MSAIGAVVLAAGSSSRLGRPKQFLQYDGDSLLRRTIRAAAPCSPIVVVTGSQAAQVEEHVRDLGVHFACHQDWARGIGSSIRSGVVAALALEPEISALVMLVCDQPFISAVIISQLIASRRTSGSPIVAASYLGVAGVPALFGRSLFSELCALPDHQGARVILQRHPRQIVQIPFPDGAIDIDTAEDCELLIAH